jgi:predicted amidohydrolase
VLVGLLICWDLAIPEAFRALAVRGGAKLIIIPAFWHIVKINPTVRELHPDSEATFLDGLCIARAYENTCAVALCNAFGRGQLTVPMLGCRGAMGVEQEGKLTSEVDFQAVEFAETVYECVKTHLVQTGTQAIGSITRGRSSSSCRGEFKPQAP